MTALRDIDHDSEDVFIVRDFNRFYTVRLGLLQRRYLNGEFSLTESRILYEIWATPRITASALRETLRLDKGYVSRILASLTQRRLVRKSVSKADSRERPLSLSPSGQRKVGELNLQSAAQVRALLNSLSTDERGALVSSLATARAVLTKRFASRLSVVRLQEIHEDILDLLKEYYESVGVVLRDTPDEVREMAEDPHGGVWGAYLEGRLVGCACLRSLASIPHATECKRLYVKPNARGNGVAQAILDAQEAFARKRGLERIYLDSKDDLKSAIALYTKRGYVPCDRYNKNPQATVFMMKKLGEESKRQ